MSETMRYPIKVNLTKEEYLKECGMFPPFPLEFQNSETKDSQDYFNEYAYQKRHGLVKKCSNPDCKRPTAKPLICFDKDKTKKDGHKNVCKSCVKEQMKKRYEYKRGF